MITQKRFITLITVVNGYLPKEIQLFLNTRHLVTGVYLTQNTLLYTQNCIYGFNGFSMFDIIITKLDKLTVDTIG